MWHPGFLQLSFKTHIIPFFGYLLIRIFYGAKSTFGDSTDGSCFHLYMIKGGRKPDCTKPYKVYTGDARM